MGVALLFVFLALLLVHWMEYRRSVQEYTFVQPIALGQRDEVRTSFYDKSPLVVEIGPLPWRPEIASQYNWIVSVGPEEETNQLMIPIHQWLSEKNAHNLPLRKQDALVQKIGFETGLGDLSDFRVLWWLPGLWNTSVDILTPGEIVGFTWTSAERSWVGCSHGGPLLIWLIHSRYRKFMPHSNDEKPIDPWSLTVADTPWIGKVQYIEVRIQEGWCIGVPAHWGFAIRNEGEADSWYWSSYQHSALSWAISNYT
jgi:hypothetical protein